MIAALLIAIGYATGAVANITLPQGKWRIDAVHVDSQRTGRLTIQPDDPTLIGRPVTVTADAIALDNGSDATGANLCRGASATVQTETLAGLIGATMTARPDDAPRAVPTDYGLRGENGPVQVFWVACQAGRFGPADFALHPGAWIVQDARRNLLIGWADATVLSATPVSDAAAISPSFDCRAAHTASERAICSSRDLAAADRSVASAYGEAKEWCDNDPGKLKSLARIQTDWQRQRDSCGADAACLKRSMEAQTAKLNSPGSFLGD